MIHQLIDKLNGIKLAIFDLDGVIYRGSSLIPNADHIIRKLKDNSIKVVFKEMWQYSLALKFCIQFVFASF